MKFPEAERRCLGHSLEGIIDIVERGGTPVKVSDNYWEITIKRKNGAKDD